MRGSHFFGATLYNLYIYTFHLYIIYTHWNSLWGYTTLQYQTQECDKSNIAHYFCLAWERNGCGRGGGAPEVITVSYFCSHVSSSPVTFSTNLSKYLRHLGWCSEIAAFNNSHHFTYEITPLCALQRLWFMMVQDMLVTPNGTQMSEVWWKLNRHRFWDTSDYR